MGGKASTLDDIRGVKNLEEASESTTRHVRVGELHNILRALLSKVVHEVRRALGEEVDGLAEEYILDLFRGSVPWFGWSF
jgi:hypothetical protein